MNAWPVHIPPVPVAKLAWDLAHDPRFPYAPHLMVEELGPAIAERYALPPPVHWEAAVAFLEDLEIRVNPPEIEPCEPGNPGDNTGLIDDGRWTIRTQLRDSRKRQTLTLFHEFYEILRAYLHEFNQAPPPEGMDLRSFVPERLATRFAAAVTMPRLYVREFLRDNGLNFLQLRHLTGRSDASVARRVQELLADGELKDQPIPLLHLGFRIQKRGRTPKQVRVACQDHVRSRAFSMRLNRRNQRPYDWPRKRDVYLSGGLLQVAVERQRTVFVARVTSYDLYGDRDLTALALPLWERAPWKEEWDGEEAELVLVGIAIYATPAGMMDLWQPVLGDLQCDYLDEVQGLVGQPYKRRKMKQKKEREVIDERLAISEDGKATIVKIFRNPWARKVPSYLDVVESLKLFRLHRVSDGTNRLVLLPSGQIAWDADNSASHLEAA